MSTLEDDVIYEIEALQAIYAEDFEERPEVWGNPCFAIKVKPQAEDAVSCSVTLVVTLNKTYPKTVPRCEVTDILGLNDNEVKELKASIIKTAEQNVGEVMIHEIVTQVETYLYEHNKNPGNITTFYEKMQNRKKLEETALDDLRSGKVLEDDPESDIVGQRRKPGESFNLEKNINPIRVSDDDDDFDANIRSRNHAGARSASLGSMIMEEESGGALNKMGVTKKSWDVENKNEFDEGNSEGGETWLTDLLKHKISENLMEYDDDLDDDEENECQQDQLLQQQLLVQQQKQLGVEGGSRYHKEFQEIQLLGKGGGGEVWKVKNNLDRRAYAVKKILLNPTDKASNNRIRREVTTISSLLHKHIVRYYAAWVEKLTIPVPETKEDMLGSPSSGNSSYRNGSSSTGHSLDLSNCVADGKTGGGGGGGDKSAVGKATTSTTIMNFK